MQNLLNDLRYALRNLQKTRGMLLVAVTTLALGIGANTAIFSVINAVLLRPLPFQDPDKLVRIFETEDAPGEFPIAGPDYLAWKKDNKSFVDMSFFSWSRNMNLSGSGSPQQVVSVATEANFFSVIGVQPILGRVWAPGEDHAGNNRIVVLSNEVWRNVFNSDPAIVGKNIELDAANYTIIGVMGPTFQFPLGTQVWVPQEMTEKGVGPRGSHGPGAIGRLKPGVTMQQAQADLNVICSRLEQQFPSSNHKVTAVLHSLHDTLVGKTRNSLLTMQWAVLLILLIACVNVANLLLSRAVARQKEMAIRCALGASRPRLIQQLLTESVLLSLMGAAAGLALAVTGVKLLTSSSRLAIPSTTPVTIDLTVLMFTLAVAVGAGVLFGLYPALQTSRPDLFEDLKGGAGNTSTFNRQKRHASNILVIVEISFSLLLLISASLLLKDFKAMRSTNIGVRTDHVWTGTMRLPAARYAQQQQQFQFGRTLLENVRQIPGVESASISDRLPLFGGSNGYIHLPGHENEVQSGALVETHNVSPQYFQALNIPVVQGRTFNDEDLANEIRIDDQVAALTKDGAPLTSQQAHTMVYRSVINKTMADHFWPGQNPIGQRFTGDATSPWHEVVGVVGDVKQWGLTNAAQPESYDIWDGQSQFNLVLHTNVEPMSITGSVRQAVAGLDSTLALSKVRSMQDLINENSAGAEFLTSLIGIFAGLALVLAAVGIYGVLSYAVTQRTREIGVRMALGATQQDVLRLVITHAMGLVVIGLVIGGFAAFASRKIIGNSLSMIKAEDPTVFLLAPLIFTVIAVLACSVPAARAARINPLLALREE